MDALTFTDLKEAGLRKFQAGEHLGAVECLRRATDLVPTSAEAWRLLGLACNESGDHPGAIAAYKAAIGLEPNNAESFVGMGAVQMSYGDLPRAITAFDEALTLQPAHVQAKNFLVACLIKHGQIALSGNDHHTGDAALERAYKIARNSPDAVVPFVEHLIASNQHKKALQTISTAVHDAPHEPAIKALNEKMQNDPKLAHARQLQALQTAQVGSLQAPRPARPVANPDEVPCPCGAIRVMRWATVCPNCSKQIGDPAMRASRFAGHGNLRTTTWIEVVYIVLSVLWLIYGGALLTLAAMDMTLLREFDMGRGVLNVGVALGLLFQVEWVQFLAKILMLINLFFGAYTTMIALAFGSPLMIGVGVLTLAVSGFTWWVIHQMSD